MEEEGFTGLVDPEKAVTRTDARTSSQGLQLLQRDDVVGRVRPDSDAVAAEIGGEDIGVGRVDDDLVQVAHVLTVGDWTGDLEGGEDCLNWAGAG